MVNIKKSRKIKVRPSKVNQKKRNKEGSLIIKKKMFSRQQSLTSIDLTKVNLDLLRPPKVWNYPIYRLKKLKIADPKLTMSVIRNVDPTKCYVDGRIQKFNKLFEQIYKNMKYYWNTGEKADTWEYFYDKVLKALNIKYQTDKLLKREQIKKAMEEEAKKKQEEEEEAKRNEEENKIEEKKEEKIINTNENKKENNISENTVTSNALNTNNSITLIKKLKITKNVQRNKKDEINTNATTS